MSTQKTPPGKRLPGKQQSDAINPGPMIQYNVAKHPTVVLVKQITLKPIDELDKKPGGRIPRGCTITTQRKPLFEYVHDAYAGGTRQYILPANIDLGTDTPLRAKEVIVAGGVDRTAATLQYVQAPALLTLDHDPSKWSSTTLDTPKALHEILIRLFPAAFDGAAWGAYDSSSSFLYRPDGSSHTGRKGFHLAFGIEDATKIMEFGDRLFKRLWIAGYGYIHISKSGSALPRTLFDKKVIEPQQPLFAGGADCHECEQKRPAPEWHPGGYINTSGLPPLSDAEEREYARTMEAAKREAKPECERLRHEYQQHEAAALSVTQGVPMERARKIIEARMNGVLVGGDILVFDDLGAVAVADVLGNLQLYDEETLAHPVDGDIAGKAILYMNAASGHPIVFSQAHGGCVFHLKHDLTSLLKLLESMDDSRAQDEWSLALPIAELSPDELERYLKAVKAKTGLSMAALRDTLRKMQQQADKGVAASLTDDPGLYLAKLLLSKTYNDGGTLLCLESGLFWCYTGTHWRLINDSVIEAALQNVATEQWKHVCAMWAASGKKSSTMAALIGSALKCLRNLVTVAGDPLGLNETRPSVINCLNGELWLTDSGPELRIHDPKSYLTSCSPINYDASATAPTFELAVRGMLSLPGGTPMPDQDEMLRHVLELLGYTIQTRRNLKVFVLIVGPGDNGKTKLAKILDVVLGLDAVQHDRLSGVDEKGSRFAATRLVGKLVIIDDDVDYDYLLPDGLLKKIAEEKPLTAEPKFKEAFQFVSQVVPWLLGNSFPRSRDLTRGMQTRANVLYLPRSFLKPSECATDDPDRQRPELWDSIFADEMSGVLNLLVAAYYRVAKRGGFAPPPSADRAFEMWLNEANVVSRFIEDACEKIDPTKPGCTTEMLYSAFMPWCDANGVQPKYRPQQNQIKKRLQEIGFKVEHCEHGTGVWGVGIKSKWLMGANPFAARRSRK
jgi:P4 family phage/plasmid primase-like protien